MRLNVGCGRHYAEGWTNTDLVQNEDIHPDIVVDDPMVLPFPDGCCERVYLGHVLEHVPWEDVPRFLAEVERVLAPDGVVMVVGPDTLEVIDYYAAGKCGWDGVLGVIEGVSAYYEHLGFDWKHWEQDRHHWNCYQDRVALALERMGWAVEVVHRLPSGQLDDDRIRSEGWPLVSAAVCQFSVLATKATP